MSTTDTRAAMAAKQAIRRYLTSKSHGRVNDASSVDVVVATHSSQRQYDADSTSVDSKDGLCLIESAVRCEHCGYCRSHGY